MDLTGAQMRELCEALADAFTVGELQMMLRFRLDKDLNNLAAPATKPMMIFEVVDASKRQGWTAQLLAAARESNPGNARLAALGGEIGLTSTGTPSQNLERLIRDSTPYGDFRPWLAKWGRLETQVCRIEVFPEGGGGVEYGTGFLVGPDLVLTNHHVLDKVIAGDLGADRVICRFDYKRLADGMSLDTGREFRLNHQGEWLLASSPASPEDSKINGSLPGADQLDYALVRLEQKAGDLPVGKKPEPGAKPRGWIELPANPPEPAANDILFLLQHPDSEPLKLGTGVVLTVNANRTRVRHDVNTNGGSSGSPCFAADLSPVALHHAGDPNLDQDAEFNQAIPLKRIVDQLEDFQVDIVG